MAWRPYGLAYAVCVTPVHVLHHRRSIRLKGYDYAGGGVYFVTVCTRNTECVFGEVTDGEMWLNAYGKVVEEEWLRTAQVRAYVELDRYVVMPNHSW